MQKSTWLIITTPVVASVVLTACDQSAQTGTPGAPTAPPAFTFEPAGNGLPEKGMWKCDPVFADINTDGFMDLAAIPRLGKGARVWFGDGNGTWTDASAGITPKDTSCGGGIDVADLDGDGDLDLAVADHCNGIYIYLGDGAGHWTAVTEGLFPVDVAPEGWRSSNYVGAEDIAVGDVNGDGHVDLLASSSDEGGINVYLGDGTGSNWTVRSNGLPDTGWGNRVLLEDMDRDGHLDVVASYDPGPRVWLNDGSANWFPASEGLPSPPIRGLYTGLAVDDINGDGRPDIASANWVDGPVVYLQLEDGTWQKTPDVFPDMMGGAVGIALGHIDQDGHMDMVVTGRLSGEESGYVRGVFVLKGNGGSSWEYVANSGLPATGLSGTVGAALADIDGDTVLDVAATSGLLVESVPGPTAPVVPHRVLVWSTRLPGVASVKGLEAANAN